MPGHQGRSDMDDTCDFHSINLSAYFDGELKGGKARMLEAHLEKCADCKDTLAVYNTIRRGMIAMSTHTGTKRSLAKGIMASLKRDDDGLP